MEIPDGLVSKIIKKITPEIAAWQNRPLDAVYPFVFMDAIHYKVKENHQYITKALERLGVKHKLIRPYTPRHNGKVECSHRENHNKFYSCHSFYSCSDLNAQLAARLSRTNNLPMRTLGCRLSNSSKNLSNIIDKLTLPEYFIVKDMPCIGETLALRIIAEIGDARRFKNKHSLVAYAGIYVPPYQSGFFNASNRHISKRGNSYLRKTAFELCKVLFNTNPMEIPFTNLSKRNAVRVNPLRKLWL